MPRIQSKPHATSAASGGLAPEKRALALVAQLAGRQHGVFARNQSMALGLAPSAIERSVASGRWRRLTRGVFAVVGAPRTPERAVMAARLVGSSEMVLSHEWAAAWWGLDARRWDDGLLAGGSITFSASPTANARIPGALVFRTASLSPDDVVVLDAHTRTAVRLMAADRRRIGHGGNTRQRFGLSRLPPETVDPDVEPLVVSLRVTTPVRTALDLLRRDVRRGLVVGRALDLLLAEGFCDSSGLASVAGRLGARGEERRRVEGVVSPRVDQSVPTDSQLEAWFETFMARHGLPRPVRQHPVPGREDVPGRVDFAWPERRVLLEVDGHPSHWTQAAARAQASRDRAALTAGWKPYRAHPGDDEGIAGLALANDLRAALGLAPQLSQGWTTR
jgi:Transcriptional regulator, AbiEi antitoxin